VNLLKVAPLYKTLPHTTDQLDLIGTSPVLKQVHTVWFKRNHYTNSKGNYLTRSTQPRTFIIKLQHQQQLTNYNFQLSTVRVSYNYTSLKKKKKLEVLHTPLLNKTQNQLETFTQLLDKKDLLVDTYLAQFTLIWQRTSYHFLTLSVIKSLLLALNSSPKTGSKTNTLTRTGGTPLLLTLKWL